MSSRWLVRINAKIVFEWKIYDNIKIDKTRCKDHQLLKCT